MQLTQRLGFEKVQLELTQLFRRERFHPLPDFCRQGSKLSFQLQQSCFTPFFDPAGERMNG